MKKVSFLLFASLFTLLFSCQKPSNSGPIEMDSNFIYDVVLIFKSAGSGIDTPVYTQIQEEIDRVNNDYGVTLAVYNYSWGREGEVDVCFDLTGISSFQSKMVKSKIQNSVAGSDLTDYQENSKRPVRK